MWDISYLASMAQRTTSSEEIVTALLDYMLEMAAERGILRIFAKVEDEIPELELFIRSGFQRYARELTYVYDPDTQPAGQLAQPDTAVTAPLEPPSRLGPAPDLPLCRASTGADGGNAGQQRRICKTPRRLAHAVGVPVFPRGTRITCAMLAFV